jgi:mono/diheme cytochrome c family protein
VKHTLNHGKISRCGLTKDAFQSADAMKQSNRRRQKVTLKMVSVAVFLSGCTAAQKPSKVETTLANMVKDVVIPIEAEHRKNPLPPSGETLSKGEKLYAQNCAICHGADGHGRTTIGRGMYPPAMDLTSPHVQHWNEAELFWIIRNGVPLTGMPSWKAALSQSDTWQLVDFIHGLPRLDAQRAMMQATGSIEARQGKSKEKLIRYGKILYRQEGCFMCHRLNGEGGNVGPDLTVEGTRGRSGAWLIGHFKNPRAYTPGSIMPAFKNLTNEQLSALVAFLQSQEGHGSSKQK